MCVNLRAKLLTLLLALGFALTMSLGLNPGVLPVIVWPGDAIKKLR
jgi:hypothetical protein